MTPETISIYISIAKIQAKRRDNWRPGFPIDRDLEHAHQLDLAILREKLTRTQPDVIEEITVPKEKFSMIDHINHLLKTLYNSFPRKLL